MLNKVCTAKREAILNEMLQNEKVTLDYERIVTESEPWTDLWSFIFRKGDSLEIAEKNISSLYRYR